MAVERGSIGKPADPSKREQTLYRRSSESLSGNPVNSFYSGLNLILHMTTLGVRIKHIFHIRFHPRVAEPLKSRERPVLLPLLQQSLRIGCVNAQPAAPYGHAGDPRKFCQFQ